MSSKNAKVFQIEFNELIAVVYVVLETETLRQQILNSINSYLQTISEYFFNTTIVCLVALAIFNISGAFSENKTINLLKCDFVKGGWQLKYLKLQLCQPYFLYET